MREEEETMENKFCARQSVCLFVRLFVSLFGRIREMRVATWEHNRGCLI